jgi:hypothetical protein
MSDIGDKKSHIDAHLWVRHTNSSYIQPDVTTSKEEGFPDLLPA